MFLLYGPMNQNPDCYKSIMYNNLPKFVQQLPLKSTLDPEIYGPPESAITTELIEQEIGGLMTVNDVYVPNLWEKFIISIYLIKLWIETLKIFYYAGYKTKKVVYHRLPWCVITVCGETETDRRLHAVRISRTLLLEPRWHIETTSHRANSASIGRQATMETSVHTQ